MCRWWQQNLDDCADCSSGEKPGRICVQFEFCATCSNRRTGSGKQTSGSNRRWGTLTETKLTNIESLSSFSMNCSWYKPGILSLASESFVGKYTMQSHSSWDDAWSSIKLSETLLWYVRPYHLHFIFCSVYEIHFYNF